ncbi:Histidine kinase [Muriicola jejuensis]|uniref:Histidine kinase n=1 Tax=Muriicola jejuensis TaxID=504488 RepID=A0A6P0UE73_9FLAO|nr:2TM domain-containing protein [Muriicola jejuensis]NER10922.1 histidine kinase [Muriicola jejuensis]SMP15555.1 Histidine kinase [Muriicola jejuensis]
MKEFSIVMKVSLLLTVVIVLLNLIVNFGEPVLFMEVLEKTGISFIYCFVLTWVGSSFHNYASRIYSWEAQPVKRLWFGAIGSVILTVLAFGLVRWFVEVIIYGADFNTFLKNERIVNYIIALVITLVVSLFIHAFYFWKALQDSKIKEQKIIAGTASAKFDALKNQLDPHFLFNSLNVLTSLIEEDPDQAQRFTTALSKVYRYVLEQKNKDLVPVDEELDFARTYIKLLTMRFEDGIQFEIPENVSNPEARIVPLSLQLLLENAVKHNVVTSGKPLVIRVYEKDGNLVVQNNLQEKPVIKRSSGVGLLNIQQRYSILSNRKVRIHKTASEFSVELPMLTKQIGSMESQRAIIEDKRYKKAKEQVEAIKGFYGNLFAYCLVIPFLAWLNYRSTDFPWVLFPALGWGLGVITHGLEAFGYNPLWGKRWEERKIREFMEQDDL